MENKINLNKKNNKQLPKPVTLKTVATKTSWEDFLQTENFSDAETIDAETLVKLFEEATRQKCVMWGKIFGFGQYHYVSPKTGRNGDWMATGFAIRKNAITIYIMSGFGNYKSLLKDLGKFKISGGSCLYIKNLEGINLKALEKLIKQSFIYLKKKYLVQ